MSETITIAVVGDVHDLWDADDERVLVHLGVDLVLLVGDFGNEALDIVRSVANLQIPKAVILGNHDAWYTATDWGRKKCPYDRQQEDRVQRQLDLLGASHVGYGKLDFPDFGLTVVGGRPFSWGGSEWRQTTFYATRYGVNNFEESANRIWEAAQTATQSTLIFIGHCGPKGLGAAAHDPCGQDWKPIGGDHGDPDLAVALDRARAAGKSIPLVAFGHMHHQLRHTKERLRDPIRIHPSGTVYLNAASVPRLYRTETTWRRNFSLVTLTNHSVTKASLVWVDHTLALQSETQLYHWNSRSLEMVE